MGFIHDGAGYGMCCLAHRELAWLFPEPHTGLEDYLIMLLSCFRKRMSGARLRSSTAAVPRCMDCFWGGKRFCMLNTGKNLHARIFLDVFLPPYKLENVGFLAICASNGQWKVSNQYPEKEMRECFSDKCS